MVFSKEAKITEFAHCLVLELYTTNCISFDYSNKFVYRLKNFQAILKLQQFVNWQVLKDTLYTVKPVATVNM